MRHRLCACAAPRFLMAAVLVTIIAGVSGTVPAQPLPAEAWAGPPNGTAVTGQGAGPMTDIHDIKALVPLGSTIDLLYAVLISAAALVIAGGIAYVLRRRRTGPDSSGPPRLPPETAALQQLAALKDVHRLDGRVFYFQLSAILRAYMEARYGLNAVEMTTEELLPKIDPLGLPQELTVPLKLLVTTADPIKFAGVPATKRKMEADLNFAHKFVKDTTAAARVSIAETTEGTVKV